MARLRLRLSLRIFSRRTDGGRNRIDYRDSHAAIGCAVNPQPAKIGDDNVASQFGTAEGGGECNDSHSGGPSRRDAGWRILEDDAFGRRYAELLSGSQKWLRMRFAVLNVVG